MPPLAWSFSLAVITGLTAAVIALAISRQRLATRVANDQRRFFHCLEHAPFCAYVKDAGGRYLYANPTLVNITRQAVPSVSSFIGHTDLDFFPAENAKRYREDDSAVLRHGLPLLFENTSVDADGGVRYWTSVKFPWFTADERPCVVGLSHEVTEILRVKQAVRASEDRYALALEAGRMGSMSLDLASGTVETSPLFATLHARPATKTRLQLGESLADVHPDDRQAIKDAIEEACRSRAPGRMLYRVIKPDGSIAWIEFLGQVYDDAAGRPATVRGVCFDATERESAAHEVARRKETLRRLIEVQENERQTLCHELHDGMMQYTIGAKMMLESIRDGLSSPEQVEQLSIAVNYLDRGIVEGRQVIRGVRSAVLDDLGLTAAIRDLADQMASFGIAVETDLEPGLDELPAALRITVYRVVQESLTNVRKHAQTDRASVSVSGGPIEVQLRITDRGAGFTPGESGRRGFGLIGMTERVRLAGGSFSVESQPGRGTRIEARLPIPLVAAGVGAHPERAAERGAMLAAR